MPHAVIVAEQFNPNSSFVTVNPKWWGGAFMNPKGQSVKIFMDWLGMEHEEFATLFETYNVKNSEGKVMPDFMKKRIMNDYALTVLVGNIAHKHMINERVFNLSDGSLYLLPHPSGRNRQLNNDVVREKCKRYGREIALIARALHRSTLKK